MKQEKKILFMVANMRVGNGVTAVIMAHYDKLLANGYQVDFCSIYDTESPYIDVIKENGGNYYILPQINNRPNEKAAKEKIELILKEGKYDVVHTHILGKYAVLMTKCAKKQKVPYRIFHSHNPRDVHDIHSFLYTLVYDTQCVWNSNYFLACSESAGKSMFGLRDFSVIRNTIDTKKTYYTDLLRKQCREELNIDSNTFVIGTVCRKTYQKNPFFLVDIFEQIVRKNDNVKLLWIGTGELDGEVQVYVQNKQLLDKVIFIKGSSEMSKLYSAMDTFLLPSKFEGLGIVYIEAQACGLPTFASVKVPKDTMITDLIEYISLEENSKYWADCILARKDKKDNKQREGYFQEVIAAGYDTHENNDLCEYYSQIL